MTLFFEIKLALVNVDNTYLPESNLLAKNIVFKFGLILLYSKCHFDTMLAKL